MAETRAAVQEWLERWYAVADDCKPHNSVKFFASDCVVQFNNHEPVSGRDGAEKEFGSIAPYVAWMKHTIIDFDVIGNRIWNECQVEYIARDDPEQIKVSMHRVNLYERHPEGHAEAGQIVRWNAFFDPTPFGQRLAAARRAKGETLEKNVY